MHSGIVGIKDAGQRFGREGLSECFYEIAVRELFKVEVVGRSRGPEAEGVDRGTAISDYGAVKWDTNQSRWTARHGAQAAAAEFE